LLQALLQIALSDDEWNMPKCGKKIWKTLRLLMFDGIDFSEINSGPGTNARLQIASWPCISLGGRRASWNGVFVARRDLLPSLEPRAVRIVVLVVQVFRSCRHDVARDSGAAGGNS